MNLSNLLFINRFPCPRPRPVQTRPVLPICLFISILLQVITLPACAQSQSLPLQLRSATASSSRAGYPPAQAIDGIITDASRWVSEASPSPAWLEIDLGELHTLAAVHCYCGYGSQDPIRDFTIQFWTGSQWRDIPSAKISNNQSVALAIAFDDSVTVETSRIRIWITATHQNIARVKEVVVWPAGKSDLPPLRSVAGHANPAPQDDIPPLYLNQSGFNLGRPKRFTAPTLPDGAPFVICAAEGGPVLYQGVLSGHIGDFSPFNPSGNRDYVVEAGKIRSVPFRIGNWWLERVTCQNSINFMIDSRHYLGNDRTVCPGSFGWRDDHHFGWELHALVAQYMSNPSAYDRMPRQIRYEQPGQPKLWGQLEPCRDDAPDMVKLIHWGADIIVTQHLTHELLKAQLAYFLYAWPALEPWLTAQNYQVVHDYVFAHWTESRCDRQYPYDESPEHNLLAVKTRIGTTKGAYPPGFSIQPNLLLHEVAKRENRSDADIYFRAACAQARWIIDHLDWNDPQTTKGQRMSECITLTGLAHLLRDYPGQAPAGLADKINQWAGVVMRRSANMWDFRKLDDGEKWTPMGDKPTMWNEPGNVLGFPAALLAACSVIQDPAVSARLETLVWSHFDNAFGRNPVGRHFSYDAPREIEGVEYGWFSFLPGGIGRLTESRFVIDGSPKDGHYPWRPEKGNIGWTEGWIQFNTPFNLSLAYLAWSQTRIEISQAGSSLSVRLRAPLNFDYDQVESGTLILTSSNGDHECVRVTEESIDAQTLAGRITIQSALPAIKGDGVLQASPGDRVEAAYGYGCWGRSAELLF